MVDRTPKRLRTTARFRFSILTLLVVSGIFPSHMRAQNASFSLDFAHFGAGPTGGLLLTTELTLINPSSKEVEEVEVEFFKQDGTANSVQIGGEVANSLIISIRAESGRRLVVESPDQGLRVGWIRVSSPLALAGVIQFKYLDVPDGILLTETALLPSDAGRKPLTFIEGRAAGIAIAVANPSPELGVEAIVSIPVRGAALKVPISLAPREQQARFLSELHPLVKGDTELSGTLRIEVQSAGDAIIGTILKLTEAGLTTFPLVVAPS